MALAYSEEKSITAAAAIKMAETLLLGIGIDTARLDAQILCEHVLGMSRLDLILASEKPLSPAQAASYFGLVKRRLCYEPIAYIINKKEFYGYDFFVDQNCLVPRPDTECVLEAALKRLPLLGAGVMLDLCAGSGAIGLSALKERTNLQLIASDISAAALAVTARNAEQLGVAERAKLVQSDLFQNLPAGVLFDIIVSNPPYIGRRELATLPPDVKDFEPHLALFAQDEAGLSFYQEIFRAAPHHLKSGGFLVCEFGFGQSQSITQLVGEGLVIIEVFADLAGIERGIVLQKK